MTPSVKRGSGHALAPGGDTARLRLPAAHARWHLDRADAELAKPGGGDPAIISAALGEARTTAGILAAYQAPRLSSVAVGGFTKMIIEVVNGLPPRDTRDARSLPPPIALVPKADGAA